VADALGISMDPFAGKVSYDLDLTELLARRRPWTTWPTLGRY
jgi:hypothetical protein